MSTFLFLAVVLLLAGIGVRLSLRGWTAGPVTPSSSQGAPYATVGYVYEEPLVPLRPR